MAKAINPELAKQLGVQAQPQIMIGIDQGSMSATMNRNQIVDIAKNVYIEMLRRPVKDENDEVVTGAAAQMFCMEQAALQAVSLFDRVQVTIDEWNAAKEAAAKAESEVTASGLELVK